MVRDDADGGDAACDPRACLAECLAGGATGGSCGTSGCQCTGADADADADADPDDAADAPLDDLGAGDADADADADADPEDAADADADADPEDAADADADAGPIDGGSCTVADFPQQRLCTSGFKCTIASLSGGSAVPICDPQGAGTNNDVCTDAAPPATTDDCARYYYCLATGSGSRCHRFCGVHADCTTAHGTTDSGCFFTLNDGAGGTVPGVRFCTSGCNARLDTGCDAGQACRLVGDSDGLFTDCSAAGAGTQGANCALGGDSACAAHYACLGSGASARCFRFCFGDADCATLGLNAQCVIGVSDAGGDPIPGFTVCTDQCDVFSDTVCSPRGQTCRLGTFTGHTGVASYCETTGSGGQNAACADGSSTCQAGFDCYNVTGYGNICLRYCRTGGGSPSCTGGTTCQSAGAGYPAGVGVCVP